MQRYNNNQKQESFSSLFFHFGCAQITPARKCSNKIGISLAYSILAAPKLLPLGNAQINLAFRSLIRNFAVKSTKPTK